MLGFARGDLFSAEFTGFASIFNCSWRHFDLQRASRLDLAFRTPNLALGSASCIDPKKNLTEVKLLPELLGRRQFSWSCVGCLG